MRFFRNAFILLACWAYAIFRGKAAKQLSGKARRILVNPASRLGDMVCATPIFHAIKEKYPDCEVVVAGLKNCEAIHDHNADVDRYVVLEENSLWSNVKKLRRLKIDVAIATTPGFEAMATFFLAGIPLIIGPHVVNGFCPYQTKSYRLLMPLFLTVEHRMRYYAPREYLKMLEPLGIHSTDTTKHIGFSKEAMEKMTAYLSSNKVVLGSDLIVGISISAGNKIKKWPLQRFAEVSNRLAKDHKALIIFIGSQADADEIKQTVSLLEPETRHLNAAGKCTIDDLKALISFFNLFIGVDTGPIYVAEALNVPTVDITGPIDENEQPPIGDLHKVVHITNRKGPELFVMNARVYDEKEARRQSDEITVESVLVAAEDLIHAIKS
jgi:heptosyltransferase-2